MSTYPGDTADPKDVARFFYIVASEEYGLPGILPVMTSCVELTQAWMGPGDVKDVPGYLSAVDHQSLGYFQQQPPWWGTPEQLVDADYALRAFCREAVKYKGQYSTIDRSELGQWCADVQRPREDLRGLYASKGYPLAKELLESNGGSQMAVTAQDLIETGRQMMGTSYGQWDGTWPPAAGAPFWMTGDVSVDFVKRHGCNCAGFLNAILRINGLPSAGGTGSIGDYLIELADFDVNSPAVPGAIALRPWSGGVGDLSEGHVAIYTGEHTLLQSDHRGVNEDDTDYDSQSWAGFTVYGKLPGVDYTGDASAPGEPGKKKEQELWRKLGWYTWESEASWNLRFYPPGEATQS